MKRLAPYVITFLILVFIALYFIWIKPMHAPFAKKPRVKDTSLVKSVAIKGSADSVFLLRKKNGWYTKEGIEAHPGKVTALLTVLQRMRLQSIINGSEAVKRYQNADILQLHIKTPNTKYHWHIGNETKATKATAFFPANHPDRLYFMHLPVYDLGVRPAIVSNPFYWRNKQIMAAKPGQIKRIQLRYTHSPKKNFTLVHTADTLKLAKASGKLHVGAARNYLSFFSDPIKFHRKATSAEVRADTLLQKIPAIVLEMQTNRPDTTRLHIYRMPDTTGNKPFNLNKAFAVINGKPPVWVLKYYVIDPWLKTRQDLARHESTTN